MTQNEKQTMPSMKTSRNTQPKAVQPIKSRRLFLSALAAAALLAAATLTTHAQNWVSVYDPAHGGIVGICGDIGTDAAGNVYAVGRQIAPDGSSVAIVQGSADQGGTWNVLDQYAEPNRSYAHH